MYCREQIKSLADLFYAADAEFEEAAKEYNAAKKRLELAAAERSKLLDQIQDWRQGDDVFVQKLIS